MAGLVLAVAGIVCTSVPGALLVLVAWAVIEKELARVESGYLPASARVQVQTVRTFTFAGVVTVIALAALQAVLLCTSFYDELWMRSFAWVLGSS